MLCMVPGYWILMKAKKENFEEPKLEECSEGERDIFMYNMWARETLLLALL